MVQNIKSWKTTLIGVVLILLSNAYAFFLHAEPNLYLYFGALAIGIILLFVPDLFIQIIRHKFLKK
jgi:hypothetical protein